MVSERMDEQTHCWECESAVDRVTLVPLPTGDDGRPRLPLCSTCYRVCYLPVVAGDGQVPAVIR